MSTRREFLQETAGGTLAALTGLPGAADAGPGPSREQPPSPPDLDSDIGSLYPFVQSQAVKARRPAPGIVALHDHGGFYLWGKEKLLVPGLYRYLDYPDVASLAMPTPLLVINGSRDELFEPSGVRASFEKLAACYAKAGVPEHVRTRLYDTPPEFDAEMQPEAWGWLAKHLQNEKAR
jgi:hypothetical protein